MGSLGAVGPQEETPPFGVRICNPRVRRFWVGNQPPKGQAGAPEWKKPCTTCNHSRWEFLGYAGNSKM